MKQDFSNQVMNLVRKEAKKLGLTQSAVAKRTGVSLPTLKRWLGTGAVTLEQTKILLDSVGLKLADVAIQLDDADETKFEYTPEQEEFFVRNSETLVFFDNLIRGMTVTKIKKEFRLNEATVSKHLSRLEKLGLVEWHPNDKVKLLVVGEPSWIPGGPLSKIFGPKIFSSFIETRFSGVRKFYLHDYLPDDIEKLEKKISELEEMAMKMHKTAVVNQKRAKAYGLYIQLSKYRWSLDEELRRK